MTQISFTPKRYEKTGGGPSWAELEAMEQGDPACGAIVDWPNTNERALHLNAARCRSWK